jgi:glycerate-2-kinase
LSSGGANIEELNTVRKQLSRIKGGGLARACRADRLITLIISDVLGDPLDVIASGPTVPDSSSPQEALTIWERYAGSDEGIAPAALAHLRRGAGVSPAEGIKGDILHYGGKVECPLILPEGQARRLPHVTNLVIGNNAVAVDAAGTEAERRGYSHAMVAATSLEGAAEDVGQHLARMALRMQTEPGPDCLITGGEPTVKLAPAEVRGKGGRNQQLVLAALVELLDAELDAGPRSKVPSPKPDSTTDLGPWTLDFGLPPLSPSPPLPLILLSGGTDGEDGPTDAAGALIDAEIISRMRELNLDPADFLRRNDAYHFFDAVGGLIKTGPTHTNVCDVRVVVVERAERTPNSGVE